MAKKHSLVKDVLPSLVWSTTGKTFNALYQQNGQNSFQKPAQLQSHRTALQRVKLA